MLKTSAKLIVTTLLTILLVNSDVLAFHKNGKSSITFDKNDGLLKKNLQSDYCTTEVIPNEITYEVKKKTTIKNKVPENKKSIVQRPKDSDNQMANIEIIESFETKEIFIVNSYHSKKREKAPKTLDFSILKDMGKIGLQTSIEKLLSYYCVSTIDGNGEFKSFSINRKIKNLYNKIAKINGIDNEDGKGEYTNEQGNGDRAYSIKGTILDNLKINLDIEEELY